MENNATWKRTVGILLLGLAIIVASMSWDQWTSEFMVLESLLSLLLTAVMGISGVGMLVEGLRGRCATSAVATIVLLCFLALAVCVSYFGLELS